jgi:hypothetical protein
MPDTFHRNKEPCAFMCVHGVMVTISFARGSLRGATSSCAHCHCFILVPATEHGSFIASWWRTPLRHPWIVTRFYFQQTPCIHAPVGKTKGCSLSGRSPAPIADSFHVATMARKHSMLNLQEINRNNMHTALVSVLTHYRWVSLISQFLRCNAEKYYLKM